MGNFRWVFILMAALIVAASGLLFGKMREKDFIAKMYERNDFMLLDAKGDFFQLQKFPKNKLLLLIFTPDSIDPRWVKPFKEFSAKVANLQKIGIEVMLITRTNREVARNFAEGAKFPSRLLLDNSGTVGRNLGVWPDFSPASYWGYALIDNQMRLYWAIREKEPLAYPDLVKSLQAVKK